MDLRAARRVAESVQDPELPMVTLGDLGVVRAVREEAGALVVDICPTFMGCPATDVILVEDWDPSRPGTYRLYVAFGALGIFRGVWDPATGSTTWEADRLSDGLPEPTAQDGRIMDRIRLAASRSHPSHRVETRGELEGHILSSDPVVEGRDPRCRH